MLGAIKQYRQRVTRRIVHFASMRESLSYHDSDPRCAGHTPVEQGEPRQIVGFINFQCTPAAAARARPRGRDS